MLLSLYTKFAAINWTVVSVGPQPPTEMIEFYLILAPFWQ